MSQSGLIALLRHDPEKVEKWDTEPQSIPGFGRDPVARGNFGLKPSSLPHTRELLL